MWACGVMLFVMLFCQYPFERPEDEKEKIQTKRYQMVSPCALELICPTPGFVLGPAPIILCAIIWVFSRRCACTGAVRNKLCSSHKAACVA